MRFASFFRALACAAIVFFVASTASAQVGIVGIVY
jgi:hypothetical protein